MIHSCPTCGQPLAAPGPCPLCGWEPLPPAQVTHLLADGLVVTLRWRQVAGVPVGEPVETLPLRDWLQRHAPQ